MEGARAGRMVFVILLVLDLVPGTGLLEQVALGAPNYIYTTLIAS